MSTRKPAPAIYQIYPRSFQDTTGSGTGDLQGIIRRLDHVAALGVDAIWLSPIYVSPMIDGGYDIVDHKAIDPMFGTDADFDALVARAHGLGLQVYMDQVLNHTSDQSPWFQAAIAGDQAMADHYLWRDPKPDGTPPNNWLSQFGLPGWTWNHLRRQYYFSQFLPQQPSLNLRHPDVQAHIAAQMRGWRDRGVDGFRFDVVTAYLWDESLQDNPPSTPQVQAKVSGETWNTYTYQDHTYDMLPGDGAAYVEKLRAWAGDDAYLFGENTSGNQSIELAMQFTTPGRLDAVYTTDLPENRGSPASVADMIARADSLQRIAGWLSSHDQPRHGRPDASNAVLALQMAFLPGPWIIYQGEEWALPQPDLAKEDVTDPLDLLQWPDGPGREGSRVPMPWDPQAVGYGFTTGTPWLPLAWDRDRVARGQAEMARFYARIIGMRRDMGWDTADVVACMAKGDVLDITLRTQDGSQWRGVFSHGAGEPANLPAGPPAIVADAMDGGTTGWHGAIWNA
ncbi:alpha-glucosidase [Loktanella fryxellensis]|uniref:Alpha-glucosidase n=1 Tax=Loktanella fryxellensis TaxID=245187 RepID=A0A1H8EG96_9RHOB|nr:alpha-amylase family glycosyl hydrolase [Loktanella fryxellensis]SEN17877.1 alpha-glucosidase [Loktanella fryxellensis]